MAAFQWLAARPQSAVMLRRASQISLVALRQLAQARGGVRAVAKDAELNANQLYRMLSPQGNPELRSLSAVLKALGLRLAVQVAQEHAAA